MCHALGLQFNGYALLCHGEMHILIVSINCCSYTPWLISVIFLNYRTSNTKSNENALTKIEQNRVENRKVSFITGFS